MERLTFFLAFLLKQPQRIPLDIYRKSSHSDRSGITCGILRVFLFCN